jgi:type II secretory pathway component PulF
VALPFPRLSRRRADFPRIYTASILAGERSGALDEVLATYVTYMRRNVALRRKIRGALAYPSFY